MRSCFDVDSPTLFSDAEVFLQLHRQKPLFSIARPKHKVLLGSTIAEVWELFSQSLPSGKLLHNYGKSPFYSWVNPLIMVIFNSYVKLPEGKEYPHFMGHSQFIPVLC